MGNKLSATDKQQIRDAFDYFDKDKDGLLQLSEVQVCCGGACLWYSWTCESVPSYCSSVITSSF